MTVTVNPSPRGHSCTVFAAPCPAREAEQDSTQKGIYPPPRGDGALRGGSGSGAAVSSWAENLTEKLPEALVQAGEQSSSSFPAGALRSRDWGCPGIERVGQAAQSPHSDQDAPSPGE